MRAYACQHGGRVHIAEAMDKVGKDGVITVEEARSIDISLDIVEWMQFDRGYLSPYFVTDPERMEVVLENPAILIHEKKISFMKNPPAGAGAGRARRPSDGKGHRLEDRRHDKVRPGRSMWLVG